MSVVHRVTAFAIVTISASVALSARAQTVGVDGNGTTSGRGRFQTPQGLCLLPADVPARQGTALVLGACDAALKQPLALGPSVDPIRDGTQGTLLSNNFCLDGDPIKGDVTFQPCLSPCDPFAFLSCYAEDQEDGTSLSQNQEWSWDRGQLRAKSSGLCLTSSSTVAGSRVSLSACAPTTQASEQAFLPLDFYMMLAAGISEPGFPALGSHATAPRKTAVLTPVEPETTFECLDIWSNLEATPNTRLDASQCNASLAQWFHFNELHELLSSPGLCMTAGGTFSQAPVELEKCTASPLQQWTLDATTPELHNVGSRFCLDVAKESPVSGANAIVNPCAFAGTSPLGQAWAVDLVWPTMTVAPASNGYLPTLLASHTPDPADPANHLGDWAVKSQQVAGDFDGDGFTDVAYPFLGNDGLINIDVYLHSGNYVTNERWSTGLGGWVDKMTFLAGDFDGDGKADVADTFDLGDGQLQIDVHLSTGSQAAGGFLAPRRWGYNQGGTIGLATWLAGDFNGDHKTDLAYIFSIDGRSIDFDVHASVGSHDTITNGFDSKRWNTGQGGWIDITVGDPVWGDSVFGNCVYCVRTGQWVVGDFNGDQLADLGLAYKNGSGNVNLDVHLSTGSPAAGFVLQTASVSQGWWSDAAWWVAGDMDDDGLDDMVNIIAATPAYLDVEVHSSRIHGMTVPAANGFVSQQYGTAIENHFWSQTNATGQEHFWATTSESLGYIFAGGFVHPAASRFADIAIVWPVVPAGEWWAPTGSVDVTTIY